MADFITKFTLPNDEKAQDESERWTILIDGSSVQKRGGVRVIINTPKRETLKYEVILTRLKIRRALGVKNLLLKSDSKLVIGQIKGEYKAKESKMQKYLKLTNQLV